MKPQNVTVRTIAMNDGRYVFETTFTVYRDMHGSPPDAVDDQATQVKAAVEALDIDVPSSIVTISCACNKCGVTRTFAFDTRIGPAPDAPLRRQCGMGSVDRNGIPTPCDGCTKETSRR